MKRILLILCLFMAILPAHAQWDSIKSEPPVMNIVKISPFHFVEGTFLLAYERMLGSELNKSLMLSAGLHSRESYDFGTSGPSFGTVEELQFRYYVVPPQNEGVGGSNFLFFKGFYAGPFLYHRFRSQSREQFDWVSQTNVQVDENINEVAGGVVLGVQIALGNRFYMDLFTGGGVKKSFGVADDPTQTIYRSSVDVGYNGVIPKIGFMIGIGL